MVAMLKPAPFTAPFTVHLGGLPVSGLVNGSGERCGERSTRLPEPTVNR